VTSTVIRDEAAINAAARFPKDDPEGPRQVTDAVDLLADQPRPEGTVPYGSPDLRRNARGPLPGAVRDH
jgi:mRNA interferase RelE/StbE